MNNRKTITLALTAVILIGAIGTIFAYLPWRAARAMGEKLLGDERTREDYLRIQKRHEAIKNDPQSIEQYTGLLFNWKTIGDTLSDKEYYKKALEAGLEGLDRLPRHALLNLNVGNIYKELGKYEQAEKRFRKAIEVAPGDPQTYLALIDLYRYQMKKSEAEIVEVYQEGLARLVNTLPLLNSFAAYLRDTNQKERALEFYRELSNAIPDNGAYKIAIEELETEIGRETDK